MFIIRRTLSLIFNFFYWNIYNLKNGSKIYNYRLSRSVKLGKGVMIRKGTEVGHDFSIGDYSYVSGPINYIESAHIGNYSSIARQTIIGVGDHNHQWLTTHPIIVSKEYGFIETDHKEPQKPAPIIGSDVWIGINAIIFRGVKIGDGAVVAAGSVVTKDVEPYSIVGGVPAKHLKYRFSEDIIEALLKIKWWNWKKERIKEEAKYMYDIQLFIKRNN